MKAKLLHDENGLKTFAIVLDKGDEVREMLLEFANTNRFADAHLTAIGAFSEVTLGFADDQHEGQCGQCTHAGMRHQLLRRRTFLDFLLDRLAQFCDRRVESIQQLQQIASSPADPWSQLE